MPRFAARNTLPFPTHAILAPDGFTPAETFFSQPQRLNPQVDTNLWQLSLHGLVAQPLHLSLPDLAALPQHSVDCTLYSRVTDRELHIGHACWGGVALTDLLDSAGLDSAATCLSIYGIDGYRVSLPLAQLTDALIATHMNGRPLTLAHGYPARLIVPGLSDAAMPRWLQRIEVASGNVPHTPYAVPTSAALLQPFHHQTVEGALQLVGIAFAGNRPIQSIEISVDAADWMPIPFEQPPSPTVWTRWQTIWQPPAPGHYALALRASDVNGQVSPVQHTVIHVSATHS
jgi:DMSO/TMAO reductase YedYZ molybdopterin-dependent catalytic subunit